MKKLTKFTGNVSTHDGRGIARWTVVISVPSGASMNIWTRCWIVRGSPVLTTFPTTFGRLGAAPGTVYGIAMTSTFKKIKTFFKKWPFFQSKVLKVPDEEDLEPFTAADSATPDDLKREERRVSRLAAEPEAPPPVLDDTPPEAAPKPVEELFPELRLLVLLPQDSWYRVLYIMRPLYLK